MLKEKILLSIVWILICITVWFSISGCALLQRTTDAIFNSKPNNETNPDTPKKQLWQTIKGLTPNWLAIPVIALGAVAMFNGAAKLGMSCIIFGSVNLFMALATSRFGFWMAVCGLIGSMLAVVSSILVKNKAIKELVFGIQFVKEEVDADIYKPKIKEILSKQIKSTKKLVNKIKSKAKLRGEL